MSLLLQVSCSCPHGLAAQRRMGSLESVEAYARRLLAGHNALNAEEADEPGEGGGLSGCREAVEITTRNPKKRE